MNDEIKQAKIEKFLNDRAMAGAVYETLRSSFLKGKGQRDIQVLAAERLAVDLLDEGWRELNKYRSEDSHEPKTLNQIGM